MSPPPLTGDTVALWGPAQQALDLVTAPPDSEPYRCLLPGRGIRAHGPTGALFEAAFCFRCRSARMWEAGMSACHRDQPFDGDSPAALDLLRRFRHRLPT
ncbi:MULTISPECIES: hypothetical protein [unclassified Streptomyces]|uniref:hypothetical protein n=1 Tax=unclassified Streptomyces TaxID=2593676 RepID=UPI0008DCE5BA|nr:MULTISPECIES: hypothetical protein [unclassified Streptomyces]OII66910.1 hypothetical protein BJP39_26765 [Streptomyces sp. CC77]